MVTPAKLPNALYRAKEVRELDRIAIQEVGIQGSQLMDRAGLATFRAMRRQWPDARHIRIFCGTGNNGGDGFVIARYAKNAGLNVKVFLLGDSSRLTPDARDAFQSMSDAEITPEPLPENPPHDADIVVDALFGTGLDRSVTGLWSDAIAAINGSSAPTLAVDIPSGLHADTGQVLGCAVQADLTITFIGLKQGMLTGKGRDLCGRLLFDDLDVPQEVYERFPPNARRIDYDSEQHHLKPRSRFSHKGDFGHVLIIGGDAGFSGAVKMAGEAAARVGAGLVSIATRKTHAATIYGDRSELMCHGIESTTDLQGLLARATVLAIGPGLGQSSWAKTMLDTAMQTELPLIIDADGLNLLAALPQHELPARRSGHILTPHPGEAARLLKCTTMEIQDDRFQATRELASCFGGIVILKGSGTLIASEADLYVASDGNPGMASGGMGDVLTGVIAGLIAQSIPISEAARLGVALHGRAADMEVENGERGMLAGDLMPRLRKLVNPEHDPTSP
uniref:Bifunctional NAD(P)H-hydrate repair enzyme n=1 Tax=Candidatus Kentrum sp. MB TaxID=2138164 RepID=A0A450X630_9GAMM|nr:MAG: NAD(P)H-hydrate epimerase [Candidatus Kentron sp. MB]VFK34804.1 MAG: NAD(P)H-hydrate epimerase [Candidatus Kentron sp. MB]VFK74192.1 MAG: NAD(P)H-hydrate epimerase [Candidatus Kentron sp. MB]